MQARGERSTLCRRHQRQDLALESWRSWRLCETRTGTQYSDAQSGCTRIHVQCTSVPGWSVLGTPGAVGLSHTRPLPAPKLRPKNQPARTFFCYEAGRRRDPPPPSFNQPPIVKYEQRRPPSPLKISLLFSHTNCLPYKPPTAHNTQASGGLHIPNPVSTSPLCKSQHAVKYSPLDLIGVALFPLARIFRSSAAIQALAAVATQNLVPALRFLSTQSFHCLCSAFTSKLRQLARAFHIKTIARRSR